MKLKKKVVIPLFVVLLLATAWMALFKPRLLPKPIQRHLFADWMIQEERRTDPAVGHLGGFRSPSPTLRTFPGVRRRSWLYRTTERATP